MLGSNKQQSYKNHVHVPLVMNPISF